MPPHAITYRASYLGTEGAVNLLLFFLFKIVFSEGKLTFFKQQNLRLSGINITFAKNYYFTA